MVGGERQGLVMMLGDSRDRRGPKLGADYPATGDDMVRLSGF